MYPRVSSGRGVKLQAGRPQLPQIQKCDLHASGEEDPGPPDDPKARPQGGGPFLVAKSGRKFEGRQLADFERFWTDFGLSRGKAEAADAWLDIPDMTDALVARICEAAKQEAADRPRLEGRGQKPKQARGWLMSRRWEDYEAPKARDPTSQQADIFPTEVDTETWRKAQETKNRLRAEWQSGRTQANEQAANPLSERHSRQGLDKDELAF